MTLQEAIVARHSVQQYKQQPIEADIRELERILWDELGSKEVYARYTGWYRDALS